MTDNRIGDTSTTTQLDRRRRVGKTGGIQPTHRSGLTATGGTTTSDGLRCQWRWWLLPFSPEPRPAILSHQNNADFRPRHPLSAAPLSYNLANYQLSSADIHELTVWNRETNSIIQMIHGSECDINHVLACKLLLCQIFTDFNFFSLADSAINLS